MEPFGYLLLIAALVLLAGLMLYAKFAGSANRKSLHHAPTDWIVASFAAEFGSDLASEGGPETVASDEVESAPQLRLDQGLPAKEGTPSDEGDGRKNYLDELQEAAAGLAMLMRSSPAARSQPALFDPMESHDTIVEEEPLEEAGPSLAEVAADGLGLGGSSRAEALLPEPVAAEAASVEGEEFVSVEEAKPFEAGAGESNEAPDRPLGEAGDAVGAFFDPSGSLETDTERERTLGELLGPEVAEQFARIDGALDLLEELVGGIESSLRLLQDPVEEFAAASFDELSEDVSAAA